MPQYVWLLPNSKFVGSVIFWWDSPPVSASTGVLRAVVRRSWRKSGVVAVSVVLNFFHGYFIFRLSSDLIFFGCWAVIVMSEFEKELTL